MNELPDDATLQEWFVRLTTFQKNRFHPLVWINGSPKIGEGTFIGAMSEVNAKEASVNIGCNCDIASFVSINVADSHKRCIGLNDAIQRRDIEIGDCVFIGSHTLVKGGACIGHHSVVAAGSIVEAVVIPPYSLVFGNPMQLKAGYYKEKLQAAGKTVDD